MVLDFWNNMRGYVVIEVYGFSIERFINLAVHKDIYIWDVEYLKNKGKVSIKMKVSIKAFRMLKSAARKTKCKIKIVEKVGYPFVVHKYRKRKLLFFGVIFFIAALITLSNFVWLVEVQGNSRISTEDIVKYCNESGLYIGTFKPKFKKSELEQGIKSKFYDTSWVNIKVKGTKVTVTITEIIPEKEIIDRTTPCDIVALKSGLITSIVTSSGTPKVKENDVVRKGDILVSSEAIVVEDGPNSIKEYVHADAEIWAKMNYNIDFELPFTYTNKEYTGEKIKSRKLYIGKFKVDTNDFLPVNPHNEYGNFDLNKSFYQFNFGENYPLPIILETDIYRETRYTNKTHSLDELLSIAKIDVTKKIINEFDFNSDIIDKKIYYTEMETGIKVNSVITVHERIDSQVITETINNFEEKNDITKE